MRPRMNKSQFQDTLLFIVRSLKMEKEIIRVALLFHSFIKEEEASLSGYSNRLNHFQNMCYIITYEDFENATLSSNCVLQIK